MLSFLIRSSVKSSVTTVISSTDSKSNSSAAASGTTVANGINVEAATAPNSHHLDAMSSEKTVDEPKAQETSAMREHPLAVATETTSASLPMAALPSSNGKQRNQRFSFRFSFLNGNSQHDDRKPALSHVEERDKKRHARDDFDKYERNLSRSEKRAYRSAVVVRSLIVGPSGITIATKPKPVSKAKLTKVKSELIHPKSANKVIAHLRAMPSSDGLATVKINPDGSKVTGLSNGPVHAVCLAYTDEEAHKEHFCKLKGEHETQEASQTVQIDRSISVTAAVETVASITNATITQITEMFSELQIVSFAGSPDLGIGQPGDGPGILSGSVPTAETVLEGIQQITPHLMALGYATGKAALPDHTGVYPPTDRMSVITYWWGFELVLPPPSITFLSNVPSIAHAVINFLTGLSLVYNGVREIVPFIRYISQYIDAEFNMIKRQNKGKGAVCAATWIMPAALVPRPWDFPDPPATSKPSPSEPEPGVPADGEVPDASPDAPSGGDLMLVPPPSTSPLLVAPNSASPVDQTPVAVAADAGEVPDIEVVPPTPPATETLRLDAKQVAEQEGRTDGGTDNGANRSTNT